VLQTALLSLFLAAALSACVLHHQRILGAAYRVFKAHTALVAAAQDIQARQKDGVTKNGHADGTKQQPVRYERILREIWELMDLKLVLPATVLSASVAYVHLLDPKRSGRVWDVVAQPGATLELVWPVVQAKVVFSLVGYVLTMISWAIFSHARWNMNEKVRQKLVKVVLTRDMELYDRAKAGELIERIRNDPSLMDDVVNHSIERSVRALIQLVGGLVMIFSHD
jgi:ABC-type multidrug transport system fused ATPase/permease subunit